MDVYEIVTEKMMKLLEQGVVPWRRPWTSTGLPRNLISKKPYRGINHFLLSASKCVSPFWLTMRQANELAGQVRKGEESTFVVFWKVDEVQNAGKLDDEETDAKTRRRFVLRYYRVWNLEQCQLPQAVLDKLPKIETHEHDPIEAAERIVAGMPNPPQIQHAGSKAFYSAISDRVTMPPSKSVHLRRRIRGQSLPRVGPRQRPSKTPCARRHSRSSPVWFFGVLERGTVRRDGSRLSVCRSRNLARGHRQPGGLCGRLAEEAAR